MNQKFKELLNSGIFWTILVGIIGVILSVWFSEQKRRPVFFLSEKPYLIFDKDVQAYDFYLVEKNGLIVKENVYNTSLVLWNKGDLPILPEDVRKEVKILFNSEEKYRILGGRIISFYPVSENIGDFSLIIDSTQIKPCWKFFDPNFAFKVQILYSAEKPLEPYVEGYVLGNQVKKVVNLGGTRVYIGTLIFGLFFFILGLVGLIINIRSWLKETSEERTPIHDKVFLGILILLVVGFASFLLFIRLTNSPVPVF